MAMAEVLLVSVPARTDSFSFSFTDANVDPGLDVSGTVSGRVFAHHGIVHMPAAWIAN